MTASPLDLDEATMQRLGHRVADLIAHHLATIREEPVMASLPRTELNDALMSPAPISPEDFDSLIASLERDVFPYHAREPHPGFLAYVPSCPTFPALLGDWIATGYNFFAGVWPVAAGPNQIEMVVLEWFRQWMGLTETATGILTSGGSGANMTAVVAARHRAVTNGADISNLTIYASAQAHSSVVRAAWIAGIRRENVRTIGVDELFRMNVADLKSEVQKDRAAGFTPLMVAASAGTTNTGTVDPLREIADFCKREALWFHIDAAYAGFAALTAEGRALLEGIELADSLTLDPHKWLFVPFECGCLMVKDASALNDAFRVAPEYLKDVEPGEEEVNFSDRGEQLTRYSRALKIWMSVKYFGTDIISSAIQDAMDRARLLETLVTTSTDFEQLSPAQFGICCFRACPPSVPEAELDALNERINARVVAGGRYLISSTRLAGKFSLRMCTLGFRTTPDDIRGLFESIQAALEAEIA
jgi:glutamate/tyrosine decarboxylase-like PLP-dependent enzyme